MCFSFIIGFSTINLSRLIGTQYYEPLFVGDVQMLQQMLQWSNIFFHCEEVPRFEDR